MYTPLFISLLLPILRALGTVPLALGLRREADACKVEPLDWALRTQPLKSRTGINLQYLHQGCRNQSSPRRTLGGKGNTLARWDQRACQGRHSDGRFRPARASHRLLKKSKPFKAKPQFGRN